MTNWRDCPQPCPLPPALRPLKGAGIWGWGGVTESQERGRAEGLLSPAALKNDLRDTKPFTASPGPTLAAVGVGCSLSSSVSLKCSDGGFALTCTFVPHYHRSICLEGLCEKILICMNTHVHENAESEHMVFSPKTHPPFLTDDRVTPKVLPVPQPPELCLQGALGRVAPDLEKNLRQIAAEGRSSSQSTTASPSSESPRSGTLGEGLRGEAPGSDDREPQCGDTDGVPRQEKGIRLKENEPKGM